MILSLVLKLGERILEWSGQWKFQVQVLSDVFSENDVLLPEKYFFFFSFFFLILLLPPPLLPSLLSSTAHTLHLL